MGKLQVWTRVVVNIRFDRYTWRARVLPAYLTVTPLVLAIAAILPDGLKLPLASASAIVFLPLSYFMSQVASDFGKQLEPALWRSWAGPPTTRFLQHDNKEFNPVTRNRVHIRLRAFGLEIPTPMEEKKDGARAIQLYASAVDELRRLTRDTERFPLVYKGNYEYGFRRNLLGLKRGGLAIAVFSMAVSAWALYHGWNSSSVVLPVPVGAVLLTGGLAVSWLVGVRPASVRITADRYARYLLEAALDLEPPQ